MKKTRVIIAGAAGRDFHNFLTFFKDKPFYNVVCFTAEQIPNITNRSFPPVLAGSSYPKGIPIYPESMLPKLVEKFKVEQVILSYSDLSYNEVMHKASIINATGADFRLLGPEHTQLKSRKPVISVTAVRTGCGKSQTTRYICKFLENRGKRVVAIRHPMPYGNLEKQVCQRFADHKDLDIHKTTIEEREEYEPLIDIGAVVYAGVDYSKILKEAEKEADIILWDGGNNDFSFYKPDLNIVIADPHRPGHEVSYYPGEINLRMADVVIINKESTAKKEGIKTVKKNIKNSNPTAATIDADSIIELETLKSIKGRRVLVVEDGPTITHGGMDYGAGTIAAKQKKAIIIDPTPYLKGSLKDVFKKYPSLEKNKILPAMGYGSKQVSELEKTINSAPCDFVIAGTPIDLNRIIKTNKPIVRVKYELKPRTSQLKKILNSFLTRPRH
jgi:predicted GTPase